VIAGFGASYCDLSLVSQVSELVNELMEQVSLFIFSGHSLGGTAALCLAGKVVNSRAVCFNAGAAPTNPVTRGPEGRAIQYHIVGDLISSHMSDEAAKVKRIYKRDSRFGSLKPHDSTNILASSGSWKIISPTEEDELYQKWGNHLFVVKTMIRFLKFTSWLLLRKVVQLSPIPNSKRWYDQHK
jgi:hypothetical protein